MKTGCERGIVISMNCKDTEKMIPAFLQDDLSGKELRQFIEHIDSCKECMEELSIQFLVAEGLERLESGNNFNLKNALAEKMAGAKYDANVNYTLKQILLWLEIAVACAIIISLVILFKFL